VWCREKSTLAKERSDLEHEGADLVEAGALVREQTRELEAVRTDMSEERSAVEALRKAAVFETGALSTGRAELREAQQVLGYAELQLEAQRVRAAEESAALTSEKVQVWFQVLLDEQGASN
jgi:phage-related tail protein